MMAANSHASAADADGKGALGLSASELRALETTRFRLQNLSNSLASFKTDLYVNVNPLPNPYVLFSPFPILPPLAGTKSSHWRSRANRQSLQSSAAILKHHTAYLLENLMKHAHLFQRLVVHPSTSYPGRTQEGVIVQLLRKKLEPEIETLVEAARDEALAAGIDPNTSFISQERIRAEKEREKRARKEARFGFTMMGEDDDDDDDDEDEDDGGDGEDDEDGEDGVHEPIGIGDVWFDALRACNERLKQFANDFDQDLYTAEERAMGIENVRTGLKRALEEEDDDSEDEDEDSEDGDGDTAMRDMQPIALSSGQPAGQSGVVGAGPSGAPSSATNALPGEDGEWMVSFGLRGNDDLPRNLLEMQRRQQAQRMR